MKFLFVLVMAFVALTSVAQKLELDYDLRHAADPKNNPANYPSLYFEYFKNQDSGKAWIKPGAFLFKCQADMFGQSHNIGKAYLQVSQTFRCWQPKLFLNVQYSGGLGLTDPRQYSYYIFNNYSVGLAYPFQWTGAYLSAVLNYRYVPYAKPTGDPMFTLYWWKGCWNYKASLSGDFSVWTENRDHGDELTKDLHGKRFYFFAEPQLGFVLSGMIEMGVRLNIYYHVNLPDDKLQVYPALAIKCKL